MKNYGIASLLGIPNLKFLGEMSLDLVARFVTPFPVLPLVS